MPIRIFCLLSLFSLLGFTASAQPPVFDWVKTFTGNTSVEPEDCTRDAAGNFYLTGRFSGTADFDSGTGVANLSTPIGITSTFIVKLNASGDLIWAKQLSGSVSPGGIVTDGSNNIYITGGYNEIDCDFDPGPSTHYLSTTGDTDFFILKLNADGDFIWVKGFGTVSGGGFGTCAAVDALANIYIYGTFGNTTDFDPGAGVYDLTSNGSSDIFILKLDNSGNFVWARSFGGIFSDAATDMKLNLSGDILMTGAFASTVDFDPGAAVNNYSAAGNYDAFILKLNASGNFSWVKCLGGANQDRGYQLLFENDGSFYIAGHFQGIVDLNADAGVDLQASLANAVDAFISRYDALGNYQWSKVFLGEAVISPLGLCKDVDNNIVFIGYFPQSVDLDPGPAENKVSGPFTIETSRTFYVKLDPSGNFIWGSYLPSTVRTTASKTIIDGLGNYYMAGYFSGTADFDPGSGTQEITSLTPAGFFLKLAKAIVLPVDLITFNATPVAGKKIKLEWHLTNNEIDRFFIERKNGSEFSVIGSVDAKLVSAPNEYFFTDAAPLIGTNYYRLKLLHQDGKTSYSKVISLQMKGSNQTWFFPNPAKDAVIVKILNATSVGTVTIVDLSGKIVVPAFILTGNTVKINIQHLPAGVYTTIYKTADGMIADQFIKN